MNGRLYDPVLRSFLMPDNFIQQPENTQNYNRYAYVLNNPLMYTDPSGEEAISFGVAVIIGAVIAATTYTLTALLADVPFSVGGLAKATFIGAASAAVTFGIGSAATNLFTNFYSQAAFQAAAHGTFQGTMTAISGGKFWSGFAAGALSSIASSTWSGGSTQTEGFSAENNWAYGPKTIHHTGLGAGTGNLGMIAFGTVSGGAGAALTGGNFWQGAVTGLVVSGLNHLLHKIDPPVKKYKVINTSAEAKEYYNNGNGEPVVLGKATRDELRQSSEYKRVMNRLSTGKALSLTGSFDVDMTGKSFHVGDTNVDYKTVCSGGNCTTVFREFVRDGFWDPNFVSEVLFGSLGFDSYQPDGMGPNLETSGSKPYRYVPSTFIYTYPNPGYKEN